MTRSRKEIFEQYPIKNSRMMKFFCPPDEGGGGGGDDWRKKAKAEGFDFAPATELAELKTNVSALKDIRVNGPRRLQRQRV
jgi:hypothetical protein